MEEKYGGKIINGNKNDDMAEYLACTDFLITDASSSMFDFALTGRPCALYFPDLKNYQGKERGFYIPIESLPFPCAETFLNFIEVVKDFDKVQYSQKIAKMMEEFGYVEDENSAKKVAEFVLSEALRK